MPRQQRILIVDDNEELVCSTSLRLRLAGYETMAAYDGEQGVASAVANHPDAIVLDVKMPVKDGISALNDLKRIDQTRDIPVVMLSASVIDQQAALEAGARFFLRKPHEGRQLVEAVNRLVSAS